MTDSFRSRNMAGIVSLVLGVLLFSVQDAIIKALSGDYPVTELLFVRCAVSLPLLAAMVALETGLRKLRSSNFWALAVRGLIMLVAYTSYYMAIAALPLAVSVALFFTAPILVTAMSGPLLGEKVKGLTWLAVLIGFAGVVVILQPGTSVFNPAALLSLLSAATYGFSMVLARRLGTSDTATVMSFYQNFVYLAGAFVLAFAFRAMGFAHLPHPALDFLVRPWVAPSAWDFGLMAACGVIAAVAMSLLTHAYRSAEASLVTIFEYTGMIWAPLWGFLFFTEIPTLPAWIGIVLIVGAGLFAARLARAHPA